MTASGADSPDAGRPIKRADPNTIQNKFMVGYQGWFTCPNDGPPVGPGHHGWLHWFNEPIPSGGRPNTDLWPDVSAYSPSELFVAPGLEMQDGTQSLLFSSRHPKTVHRHFRWMAETGVDGAFLQRFVGQCDLERGNAGIRAIRDEVGDRVREAAEQEGRVWAIMYDVTDVPPDRIVPVLTQDWTHLVRARAILDSPAYLREQGRPVVCIWGFGFSDRHYTPAQVREIVRFIRQNTPGGAHIIAGVPAHWRTSNMDAHADPAWVELFTGGKIDGDEDEREGFDALSPWTVGRYHNLETADAFAAEKIAGDLAFVRAKNERFARAGSARRVDYMPAVLPGGSGHNLSEGKWGFNDIKREGGRFLWRQLYNTISKFNRENPGSIRTVYGAMWDEYDEGTAFLPVVPSKRQTPKTDRWPFLALDAEGHDLPSDWYMRIAGMAAEALKGTHTIGDEFPSKEVQDFWASHPIYEEAAKGAGEGSSAGGGGGYAAWLAAEGKDDKDEPPPPPYSLEAGPPAIPPRSVDGVGAISAALGQTSIFETSQTPFQPSAAPPATAPRPASSSISSISSLSGPPPTAPRPGSSSISSISSISGPPPTAPRPGSSSMSSMSSLSGPPPTAPRPASSMSSTSPTSPVPQQWPPPGWETHHGQGPGYGQGPGLGPGPGLGQGPRPPMHSRPSGSASPLPSSPPPPAMHTRPPAPSGSHQSSYHQPQPQHGYYAQGAPVQSPQQEYLGPVWPGHPALVASYGPPSPQLPHSPHQPHAGPAGPHQPPASPYQQPPPGPYQQPPSGPYPPPPPSPRPAGAILGMAPVGMALNALDRFGPQGARTRVEHGVASITQTGTKLFNKYGSKFGR